MSTTTPAGLDPHQLCKGTCRVRVFDRPGASSYPFFENPLQEPQKNAAIKPIVYIHYPSRRVETTYPLHLPPTRKTTHRTKNHSLIKQQENVEARHK